MFRVRVEAGASPVRRRRRTAAMRLGQRKPVSRTRLQGCVMDVSLGVGWRRDAASCMLMSWRLCRYGSRRKRALEL